MQRKDAEPRYEEGPSEINFVEVLRPHECHMHRHPAGKPGDRLLPGQPAARRAPTPRLTYAEPPGAYGWPNCVHGEWPRELHPEVESNLVKAVVRLLVSQDVSWWREATWVIRTLHEAVLHSPDPAIRSEAASYAARILKTIPHDQILGAKTPIPRAEILAQFEEIPQVSLPVVLAEIERWEHGDNR